MKIYYFKNIRYTNTGWNTIFSEIVNHLVYNFDAKVIMRGNHRCENGTRFYIEEFNYSMPDCEMFIYDEEIDSLKIISWSEFYTKSFELMKKRNNKNDILLVPQLYDWFNPVIETGEQPMDFTQFNFKVGSTVFYTIADNNHETYPTDFEEIYNKRKQKSFSELEDKMFMLFTTQRADPYKLSELGYLNSDMKPLHMPIYFDKLIQYKIGLSIATLAEYCYRDIEYMACGVPFIRLTYLRDLDPPLIPNFHYIAIDRKKYNLPYNTGLNRIGGDEYIKAYIERFLEVKDDYEFLDFISKNAREYYLNYCSPKNRLNHMLNLLGIDPNLKLVN